ncbi:hypothetical protein CXT76_01275 [Candidatus Parvarchaeota archaeon]|jgi:hypothetical protein|nr:MAG: hypothetical protein CXT76_01275 [Candidatus Parvarchaeota archaeon]HIG52004.1 hypothetical protein [Candidatus Pacearchaeota archaeon]
MLQKKRGQISTEYLIVVGFVTFVVIGIMAVAYFYMGSIRTSMLLSQVTNFANKVISSGEEVFFSGEPAKVTVKAYLPEGVQQIRFIEDQIVFDVLTDSGLNVIAFSSDVPIIEAPSSITTFQGLKNVKIEAVTVNGEKGIKIYQEP